MRQRVEGDYKRFMFVCCVTFKECYILVFDQKKIDLEGNVVIHKSKDHAR